jgi:hypothetical protein
MDREWKSRRLSCERKECRHLVTHEAANCINQCTSPVCFEEVYGEEPVSIKFDPSSWPMRYVSRMQSRPLLLSRLMVLLMLGGSLDSSKTARLTGKGSASSSCVRGSRSGHEG